MQISQFRSNKGFFIVLIDLIIQSVLIHSPKPLSELNSPVQFYGINKKGTLHCHSTNIQSYGGSEGTWRRKASRICLLRRTDQSLGTCYTQVVYLLLVSGVQLPSLSPSVQSTRVFPPEGLETKTCTKLHTILTQLTQFVLIRQMQSAAFKSQHERNADLCQAGWVCRAEPEGWWSAGTPEPSNFLNERKCQRKNEWYRLLLQSINIQRSGDLHLALLTSRGSHRADVNTWCHNEPVWAFQ